MQGIHYLVLIACILVVPKTLLNLISLWQKDRFNLICPQFIAICIYIYCFRGAQAICMSILHANTQVPPFHFGGDVTFFLWGGGYLPSGLLFDFIIVVYVSWLIYVTFQHCMNNTYWSHGFPEIWKNIIHIWHFGECDIYFYCTLKNDIARGACARCNIISQSAMKINIARNQSAIFVLLYAYCSFKLNNSIIQRIKKM